MSGNSSTRRSRTAPIVRRRPLVSMRLGAHRLSGRGTSAGTCRSGPRHRPRASRARRGGGSHTFRSGCRCPRSRSPSSSLTSTACTRETVTSSRNTAASGERPISTRSSSSGKGSPCRPPPERTTSAVPSIQELVERRVLGRAPRARTSSSCARRRRRGSAALRTWSSSSRPRGSGSRTRGSARGSRALLVGGSAAPRAT